MAELGAASLAFTEEEADSFLKGRDGLGLVRGGRREAGGADGRLDRGSPARRALHARPRDASGFVETFSGSNRDVLDFLAEEVLEIQPERERVLLATSVLERLSAPLCDTLTGNNDGEMLKRLERKTSLSSLWTTSGGGTATITSSPSSCEAARA